MACTINVPFEFNRFIGCDGAILSDELLQIQLKKAIEIEDYEDTAVIRDELKRRLNMDPDVITFTGKRNGYALYHTHDQIEVFTIKDNTMQNRITIIYQCPNTKLIKLENNVQIGFLYNELANEFMGSLMFQGIPHYHTIKTTESKQEGYDLVKKAGYTEAILVFDEIISWPSMKPFSKQDIIDWWNGNY